MAGYYIPAKVAARFTLPGEHPIRDAGAIARRIDAAIRSRAAKKAAATRARNKSNQKAR